MVFSRRTLLKALNFGLIFTNDVVRNIKRECRELAIMEPVCAYAGNVVVIGDPDPLPAPKVPEAVVVMNDGSQAYSAGGEADKQTWWPNGADVLGYLGVLLPLLTTFVDFLPAWLRPANDDDNRQQEADRMAAALEEITARLAEQERAMATLRAEPNRAPDGDNVEGIPEGPAEEVLPGEASSSAEPKGENSIHAASEGESEAFETANSGLNPDDEPEQAEGSTADAGTDDGHPKRRTHRSKAGRENRHLKRAREREEEAERAEEERDASFAALFKEGEGQDDGEKGKVAVGTPRVRLPEAT